MATHFENVGKIGSKPETHRCRDPARAVMRQGKAFIHPAFPEKSRTLDVDDTLGRHAAAKLWKRTIGNVGVEENIVLADTGAQERRCRTADREREPRQQARVVEEKAVAVAGDISHRV